MVLFLLRKISYTLIITQCGQGSLFVHVLLSKNICPCFFCHTRNYRMQKVRKIIIKCQF